MGLFMLNKNSINDPDGIQKDPINVINVKNHVAREINNLYN
jgi:hypothetical protein|tara:strand:+ start:1088 stop:1210 length:123 start_codon:yes stop_codon:yes gene_type:complete